jgi:RND family efflux transporter MFP subunit
MKKLLIILLVIGTLGGLAVLIMQRAEKVQTARAEQAKPVILPKVSVKVSAAVARDFANVVEVTGEVRAKRVVQVYPKLGGRIEAMDVALGQRVAAGDVLARVEENDLGWREKQGVAGERAASAGVRQAAAQVDILKIELERAKKLHAEGALPEADLVRVQGQMTAASAALNAARAQVDVAKAGSGLAKEARSWTVVESPIDGVVTRRFAELGATAGPQMPMFELQDQSTLEIRVDVPAHALDTVKAAETSGAELEFTVTERPGKVFKAKVKAIGRSLDAQSRRIQVELEASGDIVDEGVLPAMMATIHLRTGERKGLVAVPREALITTVEGPSVFVVRDGKAKRLVAGDGDRTHVPVAEGLAVGDEVVIEGQETLRDGTEVQVVKPGEKVGAQGSNEAKPAGAQEAKEAKDDKGEKAEGDNEEKAKAEVAP